MPQQRKLGPAMPPQATGELPNTPDAPNDFMHALGVALGIDEQRPGDAMDAIGALAPMAGMFAVPPKTAKEFARLMGELITEPDVKAAWETVRRRAPRVLGHTRELSIGKPAVGNFAQPPEGLNESYRDMQYLKNALSENSVPLNQLTPEAPAHLLEKQSSVSIDPNVDPADLLSNLGHETAHTAQRISKGGGFQAAYDQAGAKAAASGGHPYWDNKYEQSATKTGDDFVARERGLPVQRKKLPKPR